MPRVAPNTKKDEYSMKYTTINIPLAMNPKMAGSSYLRTESNTIWGRKKTKDVDPVEFQGKKGSNVIVIHPGSRYLRMGRASDSTPLTISNVIARKHAAPVPPATALQRVYRSQSDIENTGPATKATVADEYGIEASTEDPVDARIASIAISLRDRMRFYKIQVAKDAAANASNFNSQVKPEIIPEENDPHRIHWVTSPPTNEFVVGERVVRLVEPHKMGFSVRWPLYGNRLNIRQYSSLQELMGDVEAIWTTVLRDGLKVERKAYGDYSVVLVVPDFYDRTYLREMCRLILVTMGFKQLCIQQESLSATFGAGISNACVIDIGAVKTSIACVDEGMVNAESRIILSMGGDDITEFLFTLLQRIKFPYRDANLARAYDWQVLEDLKARLCTLAEGDVAEKVYDLTIRKSGKPTEKYAMRAYDEIILAPMCIFEPRIIDFDLKQRGLRPTIQATVEEVVDIPSDYATQAMLISTQHLLPLAPPPLALATQSHPVISEQPAFTVAPQPAQEDQEPPRTDTFEGALRLIPEPSLPVIVTTENVPMETETPELGQERLAKEKEESKDKVAMDIDPKQPAIDPTVTFAGGFPIDAEYEASKLPMDVAVFNSARAAGGDEKIRKYLQAVLVIGGTSLVPGMVNALESRLQAIATPLVSNMEKVQIIPPPKDVDPRILVWKGACVLAKMDGVNDMWVDQSDWDKLELRAIRERCFFF